MSDESQSFPILTVLWSDLAPHHRRGALWVFSFDLQEAAQAISEDQTRIVQAWIDSGDLRQPTNEEVVAWENLFNNYESEIQQFGFPSVIVQPFVIIPPTPRLYDRR